MYSRLEEVLGPRPAATLMEHLPPVGWADVATKRDLDVLGNTLRLEMQTLRAEVRTEMAELRTEVATLRTDFTSSLQRSTIVSISVLGTLMAIVGGLASVI